VRVDADSREYAQSGILQHYGGLGLGTAAGRALPRRTPRAGRREADQLEKLHAASAEAPGGGSCRTAVIDGGGGASVVLNRAATAAADAFRFGRVRQA